MGVKTMPKVKKSPKSKNKKHSNVVPIRKDLKSLKNDEKCCKMYQFLRFFPQKKVAPIGLKI